jgi:hypothetical protein
MERALEAHHGGDAGKGLVVDCGWRIGAEKIDDAEPKNKHKLEKTKNNKELTKQGKVGKEPKAGKTVVGLVQARYPRGRGVGSLTRENTR